MTFFKNGEDALKLDRGSETRKSSSRSVCGLGFTENLWGGKACDFVKTTMQLTKTHWEEIIEHAAAFVVTNTLDSDNETNANKNDTDTETIPNMRATIDLDWCIQHRSTLI